MKGIKIAIIQLKASTKKAAEYRRGENRSISNDSSSSSDEQSKDRTDSNIVFSNLSKIDCKDDDKIPKVALIKQVPRQRHSIFK